MEAERINQTSSTLAGLNTRSAKGKQKHLVEIDPNKVGGKDRGGSMKNLQAIEQSDGEVLQPKQPVGPHGHSAPILNSDVTASPCIPHRPDRSGRRMRVADCLCAILVLGLVAAGGLTACHNRGSSDSSNGLTLNLGFGVKQFQFSWNAVSGANYYRLYEDPNGVSGFAQLGGNLTATHYTKDVAAHLHNWANARYFVEACNSSGCSRSNEVNTATATSSTIGSYFANQANFLGGAVAVSRDGNTLVVGAFSETTTTAPGGAVYVFARDVDGVWWLQAHLHPLYADVYDSFGFSVALSADGNTLAVGAEWESSAATGIDGDASDNTANLAGAAYVYTRSGGVWSQQAYMKASNTNVGDRFGRTVALSDDGKTLAVGSGGEDSAAIGVGGNQDDNSIEGAGAVYVFTRDGSNVWSQQAYIKSLVPSMGGEFGGALAVSADGNTLAVGAPQETASGTSTGAVYVFSRSGTTWLAPAYVLGTNTDFYDRFGTALALSADGNTLAVGAPGQGDGGENTGAVYVFTRDTPGGWVQQGYIQASNAESWDLFGGAVALSADGNVLVVGADGDDSPATGINGDQGNNVDVARDSGAAFLFTRNGAAWSQKTYIKPKFLRKYAHFYKVALSGDANTLAVGAGWDNSFYLY